jgi:ATP-dependent DNA helicase DinG
MKACDTPEPVVQKNKVMLNGQKIIAELEEGGAIAKRLKHYENRKEQLALMALIIKGFNEDAHVAAEAGTGVGKSFAYLLPAISFALANEERIVISTATITLQQQLFEKDIPLVISALGLAGSSNEGKVKMKAALIKGRANYLCRRRLNDALLDKQQSLDEGENNALQAIDGWAQITATGSKSELDFMPPSALWQRVCSEADSCMGLGCSLRENCFITALRREAAAAKILVVNHHLLFADLSARIEGAGYDASVVLPPYRRVIIDEAHNIEKNATSFFTGELGRFGIIRNLGRLYRERGTAKSGSLHQLIQRLPMVNGNDNCAPYSEAAIKIHDAMDALNKSALDLCGTTSVFRFIAGRKDIINDRLISQIEMLRASLLKFCALGEAAVEAVIEQDRGLENVNSNEDETIWDVKAGLRRLQSAALLCGTLIEWEDHPLDVIWIERHWGSKKNGEDYAVFHSAPISIADSLSEALFAVNKTVICVSATLTISSSFDFWCRRTGIKNSLDEEGNEKQILFGNFPSPFPYETSVLTASPLGAPLPTGQGYQDFLGEAVLRLTETSGGSALVLFTSFESLRNTYNYCAPVLQEQGLRCLKQGDDDRHRLLTDFLEDKNSVLFATDSFWEGVDAPGETLRMLIICRLPFVIPNDPVFEARCELIDKRGGNSFLELSVPQSVMKFRQGFGRLIRRADDRGVVAVLDARILTKSYGQIFLRSIPKTKTCFSDLQTILREAERVLF